jgi:osmotically-inducible protein OsmY
MLPVGDNMPSLRTGQRHDPLQRLYGVQSMAAFFQRERKIMKAELAATCVALGLIFAPVAGYSAEKKESMTEKAKEGVEDAAVTTKIKAEYAKDKAVSAMNISVNTDHGVVTLTGNAKSKAESDKAESLAKSTKGVTSVKNELKVVADKK